MFLFFLSSMPSVFLLLQESRFGVRFSWWPCSMPMIPIYENEYSKTRGPQLSKSRCAKVLGAAGAGGHGEHGVVAAEPHWEGFHEVPSLGADFYLRLFRSFPFFSCQSLPLVTHSALIYLRAVGISKIGHQTNESYVAARRFFFLLRVGKISSTKT